MSRPQRNEFDLGSWIKSKKVKKENRNLGTKEEKYIVVRWPNLTTQNSTQLKKSPEKVRAKIT